MPGAGRTRSLVCGLKKAHKHSHHRLAETIPAFPARWCYGLLRSLPGDRAFCLRRRPRCKCIATDLIPASGYQNATTSPSAVMSFVGWHASRPSHPAPNVRDDRETPLLIGHGMTPL